MTFAPRMTTSPRSPWGRPPVPVDDADLLAGQREAHGAGLAHAVVGVEGRGARPLGEPVALDEHDAERSLDAGDQLGRHRGRAADHEPQ